MKKRTGIILMILCVVMLTGCQTTKNETTKGTSLEIAASIYLSQSELPPMTAVEADEEYFATYLNYYKLDSSLFEEGTIAYAGGVEASEIAVLVVKEEADIDTVESALTAYSKERADAFYGYVPDQAALAENGIVAVNGRYVALIIAADTKAAKDAFLQCFDEAWTAPDTEAVFIASDDTAETSEENTSEDTGSQDTDVTIEPTESAEDADGTAGDGSSDDSADTAGDTATDTASGEENSGTDQAKDEAVQGNEEGSATQDQGTETTEDPYDEASVLYAWQTGDTSELSVLNLAVLEAAKAVIDEIITEDMSDYDKELAIHDYITAHYEYDPEELSHDENANPNPNNDNPYGMLVDGVGICKGYTYTFQLFMDMLSITCISIEGTAGEKNPHAWNMVQLDGKWYCVDVTWDDTVDGPHRFFNVTSQYLRETYHQWDESKTPEAL